MGLLSSAKATSVERSAGGAVTVVFLPADPSAFDEFSEPAQADPGRLAFAGLQPPEAQPGPFDLPGGLPFLSLPKGGLAERACLALGLWLLAASAMRAALCAPARRAAAEALTGGAAAGGPKYALALTRRGRAILRFCRRIRRGRARQLLLGALGGAFFSSGASAVALAGLALSCAFMFALATFFAAFVFLLSKSVSGNYPQAAFGALSGHLCLLFWSAAAAGLGIARAASIAEFLRTAGQARGAAASAARMQIALLKAWAASFYQDMVSEGKKELSEAEKSELSELCPKNGGEQDKPAPQDSRACKKPNSL